MTYFQEQIPRLLKKHKVPGAAIAVIVDGTAVMKQGFGYADEKKQVPVTSETIFQLGSISKPMTAWGVMKLVQEGIIGLDQPIETYLTRWHLPESGYDHNQITVRRLLSHTAGLSLHGYPGFKPDDPLPTIEESLDGIGLTGGVRVKQPPGRRFSYSGGGYTVLQLMIEEVTGETFNSFMTNEVLIPLGMHESTFSWQEVNQNQVAKGYDMYSSELPNYLFTEKAAAGLYSNLDNLINWLQNAIRVYHHLPDSRTLITPENLHLMFSPVLEDYGLGYMSRTLPGDLTYVHHAGANFGWKAYHGMLMEKNAGLIILTNSDRGQNFIEDLTGEWFAWHDLYYRQKKMSGFDLFFLDVILRISHFFD